MTALFTRVRQQILEPREKRQPPLDLALLLYDLTLSRKALLSTPDTDPAQLRALGLEAIALAARVLQSTASGGNSQSMDTPRRS